jgi:hypothetical protein
MPGGAAAVGHRAALDAAAARVPVAALGFPAPLGAPALDGHGLVLLAAVTTPAFAAAATVPSRAAILAAASTTPAATALLHDGR